MPVTKSASRKRSVRVRAFAKINLCLHVLGRRADSYHELRTVFQAISLHDTLELSATPSRSSGSRKIDFTTDDPSLPLGGDNLVMRALQAICTEISSRGN